MSLTRVQGPATTLRICPPDWSVPGFVALVNQIPFVENGDGNACVGRGRESGNYNGGHKYIA